MICKKHNRLVLATISPDQLNEKNYCAICIKELEKKVKEPTISDILTDIADNHQQEFLAWIEKNVHVCVDGECKDLRVVQNWNGIKYRGVI